MSSKNAIEEEQDISNHSSQASEDRDIKQKKHYAKNNIVYIARSTKGGDTEMIKL